MTNHTVDDALLLQCNSSELPTCHILITATNGTVTAQPPTSVSMTTATKTALTRSEACFCHPETYCFLSCSPEDTFDLPLCQTMGSMISHPLIQFDSAKSLLVADAMEVALRDKVYSPKLNIMENMINTQPLSNKIFLWVFFCV